MAVLLVMFATAASGCGTWYDTVLGDGPRVYGGFNQSIAGMEQVDVPGPLLIVEMLASFCLDTLLLPITVPLACSRRSPDERRRSAPLTPLDPEPGAQCEQPE